MDKKLLSRLQAQCAKREYCIKDIRSKALKALDGDEAGTEEIVESLKADGFVDDARYASAFTREKSELSGWGPVKIRYALAAKGITGDAVARAAEDVDSRRASDKLERAITNKAKSLAGDPQWKYKTIRFALGRGYDYDSIAEALAKLDIGKSGADD